VSARPDTPNDISADAADFLQRTFEINHNARPTAAALLEHPFIVAGRSPTRASVSLEQASATLNAVAAARNQPMAPLSGLGIGLTMKQ
jgi:mitogen-activated protein kinase kinase kinase